MCNPPIDAVLVVPSRWACSAKGGTHEDDVKELDKLAEILAKGTAALSGLYLRICDLLRARAFSDEEMREVLGRHFPAPRVSEFIRIANAPPQVYRRYYAGFIGFRAALSECRGYTINSCEHLKRRQIRRAAARLVSLMGQGELDIAGRRVTVI